MLLWERLLSFFFSYVFYRTSYVLFFFSSQLIFAIVHLFLGKLKFDGWYFLLIHLFYFFFTIAEKVTVMLFFFISVLLKRKSFWRFVFIVKNRDEKYLTKPPALWLLLILLFFLRVNIFRLFIFTSFHVPAKKIYMHLLPEKKKSFGWFIFLLACTLISTAFRVARTRWTIPCFCNGRGRKCLKLWIQNP